MCPKCKSSRALGVGGMEKENLFLSFICPDKYRVQYRSIYPLKTLWEGGLFHLNIIGELDGPFPVHSVSGDSDLSVSEGQLVTEWTCDFVLSLYPFGTQRCTMVIYTVEEEILIQPDNVKYTGQL